VKFVDPANQNYTLNLVNGKLYINEATTNEATLELKSSIYEYGETVDFPKHGSTFGVNAVYWLPYEEYQGLDPENINPVDWNEWSKTLRPTEVGTYAVMAYTPAEEGNYPMAVAIKTLNITKRIAVITVKDGGKTYDGVEVSLDDIDEEYVSSAGGDFVYNRDYTLSVDKTPIKNAGKYNITVTPTEQTSKDYAVIVLNGTYEITKKDVTVSGITAANKTYDGNTSAILDCSHAVITGNVDGDNLTVAAATGKFEDANAGEGKTVTISDIELGGTAKDNYSVDKAGSQSTANLRSHRNR
jgi:hypothetical protein